MKKYILMIFAAAALCGCNKSEAELLQPKVYFEDKEFRVEVTEETSIEYIIQSRLSTMCDDRVNVSYEVGDQSYVDEYNKRHGTNYEALNPSSVSLSIPNAYIMAGNVYSSKVYMNVTGLENVQEGKFYVVPVVIKSASQPIIDASDVTYLIVTKPVRIMTVANFSSSYIRIPLPADRSYKSITYEALINMSYMGSNNTIMGCEGVLILRIGDTALPDAHNDWIQIAGNKQYHSTQPFVTNTWYHVAFTYDQPSGKTVLYINGAKAAESTWDTPSFDGMSSSAGGFFIGKVAGFMWGERPFYGSMSEVRLWSVARTENQILQNMTNVDPDSEGLDAYYKLNGTDQFRGDDGLWYVRDASSNGMHGIVNGGRSALSVTNLDTPLSVK